MFCEVWPPPTLPPCTPPTGAHICSSQCIQVYRRSKGAWRGKTGPAHTCLMLAFTLLIATVTVCYYSTYFNLFTNLVQQGVSTTTQQALKIKLVTGNWFQRLHDGPKCNLCDGIQGALQHMGEPEMQHWMRIACCRTLATAEEGVRRLVRSHGQRPTGQQLPVQV